MRSKAKIIWEEISVYLYISLGLIIYGTGVTLFMIPYQITSGGVTGISSLIFYATGTIEVQVSYLTINAFLLIIADCDILHLFRNLDHLKNLQHVIHKL